MISTSTASTRAMGGPVCSHSRRAASAGEVPAA